MNSNIHSLADLVLPTLPTRISSPSHPKQHTTWFSSYDEEWAAFLAESSLKKTRPGINHEIPETLPRVWNSPR